MPRTVPVSRIAGVDLLRGFALLFIFVDHIPGNRLADFTLHAFGFSDAAELFVLLAGFSATIAYSRLFENGGLRAGLSKVFGRCLKLYGVQVGLLLTTLLVLEVWTHFDGMRDPALDPLLRDGLHGALRGLTLFALPAFLDILPLYILLLGVFPLVRWGLSRSIATTFAVSLLVWGVVNATHFNLPNLVDPADIGIWGFNPFAWQLIFVAGAALAVAVRRKAALFASPSRPLVALCCAYLVFAFFAQDAWSLWQRPFGSTFPGNSGLYSLLGNEPKTFVSPWRLLHVLAIVYLAMTSGMFERLARSAVMAPVAACGRHSLAVFAAGCILALFGRLLFRTYGTTPTVQILVNGVGITALIALAVLLARAKSGERVPREAHGLVGPDEVGTGWSRGSHAGVSG